MNKLAQLVVAAAMTACTAETATEPAAAQASFGQWVGTFCPADSTLGYREPDSWIWGSSVLKGEDGKYHLYASRWPKKYPMLEGYIFYSHIVHAVADHPEGPYQFADTAIGPRPGDHWDGKMAHNPSVMKYEDAYYLFYIGSTYEQPAPDSLWLSQLKKTWLHPAYKNIRIGVARSASPYGPWERFDEPILQPTPDGWDSVVVTNPAPVLDRSGTVKMVYRTFVRGEGHRLGLAQADHPLGPYEKLGDGPISAAHVEDPRIWIHNGRYHIVAKDMTGKITGEEHAGVYLWADSLSTWHLPDSSKAYSRFVDWGDTTIQMGSLERAFVLQDADGQPSHFFFAVADGPGGFRNASDTWNVAIPMCPPQE